MEVRTVNNKLWLCSFTCCESSWTASACFALRRSCWLTDKMASPTYNPWQRSAGWPSWISDIRMGTPCSLPPCKQQHTNKHSDLFNKNGSFFSYRYLQKYTDWVITLWLDNEKYWNQMTAGILKSDDYCSLLFCLFIFWNILAAI